MNKLMTVEEVADILQQNKFTIYKLISNKQIGFIKLGTSSRANVRISEEDLQEYLDKCKSE